jgi:riboflavin biosynthesis pyrimidine reductase
MEWQTSTYSFNKYTTIPLPAAAANVERLIENFITLKHVGDQTHMDPRAIKAALALRRKSATKVYAGSPRIKDFGTHIQMTVFVFDGAEDVTLKEQQKFKNRKNADTTDRRTSSKTDLDRILEPEQQAGLQSLIARIYGKPVDLRLVKLAKPHLDAEILAAFVAQRLCDRNNTPRRVIRDSTWKAPLPDPRVIAVTRQTKALKLIRGGKKFAWQDLSMKELAPTCTSAIMKELAVSQVSSVQVEAAGRLTKRLTANRSARKMARRGTTTKLPSPILLGHRKKHLQYAFRSGKRRVGQYGIRVLLGHT